MYYNLHYITIYVSFAQAIVQNLNTYKNLKERILGDESSNIPIVSKCKIGYTKYIIPCRTRSVCPIRGMKYGVPRWACFAGRNPPPRQGHEIQYARIGIVYG